MSAEDWAALNLVLSSKKTLNKINLQKEKFKLAFFLFQMNNYFQNESYSFNF